MKAFSDPTFLTSSGSAFHFRITLTLKLFLRISRRTFSIYRTSLFLDSPSVVIVVVDLAFRVSSSFLIRNHEEDDVEDDDDAVVSDAVVVVVSDAVVVRDGTIPCPVPSRGTGSGTGRDGFFQRDF